MCKRRNFIELLAINIAVGVAVTVLMFLFVTVLASFVKWSMEPFSHIDAFFFRLSAAIGIAFGVYDTFREWGKKP